MYIENPKTKGSSIVCAIPQEGRCPNNCADCFFQSGRSYLADNLPNMPNYKDTVNDMYNITRDKVVRVNDGNDSNHQKDLVIGATKHYVMKFYNTCSSEDLEKFPGPVVLTVNPGPRTDRGPATLLSTIPKNLMFVRVRVNMWNLRLVKEVVEHYSKREVPIVLTFMAYFDSKIPKEHYTFQKRTLNSYWVLTAKAWETIIKHYSLNNKWVYTCGKNSNVHACKHCGNCLREYFATMEKV